MEGIEIRQSESQDEEFAIYACDEEDVVPYRALCKSSPKRIVRALRATVTIVDGEPDLSDSTVNVAAVLFAVGELVKGTPSPDKLRAWRKLVDVGVVDALTDNILRGVMMAGPLSPDTPQHLKEKAEHHLQAPYYPSLEILSNAARFIEFETMTAQDRVLLTTLKAKWSKIMDRLWNEPFNSLRQEESHAFERVVVASLFHKMLAADPSILDVAYSDRTIPVITRHWAYSGSCANQKMDGLVTSAALSALTRPSLPKHVKYMTTHRDLSNKQIFSQMCVGAARYPNASNAENAEALLDAFGTRLAILNGREVEPVLKMVMTLYPSQGLDLFRETMNKNKLFWAGLFSVLKRIKRGQDRDMLGQVTRKEAVFLPIFITTGAFTSTLPQNREVLIKACLEGGLLDALDDTIEYMLDVEAKVRGPKPQICRYFARLFLSMRQAVPLYGQETKDLLKDQFPRWPMLSALVWNDIRQDKTSPAQLLNDFTQLAWQLLCVLHSGCKQWGDCLRRGCSKPGVARCAKCKAAVYCGAESQKKDWKAHKFLCSRGFMTFVERAMQESDGVGEMLANNEGIPF